MKLNLRATHALALAVMMSSLVEPQMGAARSLLDITIKQPPRGMQEQFNQQTLNERLLGWREFDNIPYVPGSNDPEQTLDLLLPDHNRHELVPLVVYIHGGGWYQGDKKLSPARVLANFGYAVASINYRLTGQAKFPAQIDDCRAAVAWLRVHGRKYGIDPARIGVWGLSAGGHLAALLGATSGTANGGSAPVKAVVDWFGPTDFTGFVDLSKLDKIAEKAINGLFGGSPAEHKEEAVAASPVTYVKPGVPPFLIMHGDRDNIVPLSQSKELYDRLKSCGADAKMVVVPGAGHEMFGPEYVLQVVEFLNEHLNVRAHAGSDGAS